MKIKKLMFLLLAGIFVFALAGCGNQAARPADTAAAADEAAPSPVEETAGFEEFPIGDDIELGPLNVAGVYFQPVDMLPVGNSLPAAQADMHMEADISALDNELGYGVGDFVPYLTVQYQISKSDGSWNTEGTFMPMNASDGPHYGANLKLDGAGTYKVRFIIQNPETQGYLLHVDQETGVPGRFWNQPLAAEWDFDFVPRVW
ncbi:MAG: iron transporter [Treponema sp.]|nr:iron transporter [Treponema sp.]